MAVNENVVSNDTRERSHSETSLKNLDEFGGSDHLKDIFQTVDLPREEWEQNRTKKRRSISQPGPVAGNTATALALRTNRQRRPRNVMYADQLPNDARGSPKIPLGQTSSDVFSIDRIINDNTSEHRYFRTPTMSMSELRQGFSTPRKRSLTIGDGLSLKSIETIAPPVTSEEDKYKSFSHYLTTLMSCMYAIFLVTLGLIIFIFDGFIDEYDMSPIYGLYLISVGFVYIIFISRDIRRYVDSSLKNEKTKEKCQEANYNKYKRQEDSISIPEPYEIPPALVEKVSHDYCFSTGRHAGSFYLKLGAAGFALGHLVHSILLLSIQVGYIFEEGSEICVSYTQTALDVIYPIYSFVQLYFIFKYSNVILLRYKVLGRFGFMHFIGSSLCFWIWTIIREIAHGLLLYYINNASKDTDEDENESDENYSRNQASENSEHFLNRTGNEKAYSYVDGCAGNPVVRNIFQYLSPYLYPFTVEYSILIVGVFYIIWHNIGNCENKSFGESDDRSENSVETTCKLPSAIESNGYSGNFVIYADCHASNKGIFGGLIVVVLTIASLILAFIFSTTNVSELESVGDFILDTTNLCLNTVMLIVVVVAYNKTRTLDVNKHPVSLLDDILLFVCIPAFFMETVFTMIATIAYTNVIKCTNAIVMTVQVLIQTAFLIDGLRRCCNSRKLRRSKPGRELVMFLLITNVALWIFTTFSYTQDNDERYTYYGKVLWSILGHINLPLCMFYRFHSSVCLADMWKSAYQPGSSH